MDECAEIINGIRVVNDQEPIDFNQRDGWGGGPVLPDDPTEEYPVRDGTRQNPLSEAIRDGAAGVIEGTQATLADTYDPTESSDSGSGIRHLSYLTVGMRGHIISYEPIHLIFNNVDGVHSNKTSYFLSKVR